MTETYVSNPVVKSIRRAVKLAGYKFTHHYNDNMGGGKRRIKFLDKRPHSQYDASEQMRIDEVVRCQLELENVDYDQAGWIICKEHTPHEYTAYAVLVEY